MKNLIDFTDRVVDGNGPISTHLNKKKDYWLLTKNLKSGKISVRFYSKMRLYAMRLSVNCKISDYEYIDYYFTKNSLLLIWFATTEFLSLVKSRSKYNGDE